MTPPRDAHGRFAPVPDLSPAEVIAWLATDTGVRWHRRTYRRVGHFLQGFMLYSVKDIHDGDDQWDGAAIWIAEPYELYYEGITRAEVAADDLRPHP